MPLLGTSASQNIKSFLSLNSWTTKAAMPIGQYGMCVKAYGTDIYLIGGEWGNGGNYNYKYDTVADTWTQKANMPTTRYGTVGGIIDDKFYVIGGVDNVARNQNEMYDITNNSWTTKAVKPTADYWATGDAVGTKVYYFGNEGTSTKVEIYDSVANTWSTGTNSAYGSGYGQAVAVGNYIYKIAGGDTNSQNKLTRYDTINNSWTTLANLPVYITTHVAGLINGKYLQVATGITTVGGTTTYYVATNLQYNIDTDTWTTKTNTPLGRLNASGVGLGDKLYVFGGQSVGNGHAAQTDVYTF